MANDNFFDKKDELKTKADEGDIIACAELGAQYITGCDRPANERLGLHYIEKAAEAGYAASCLYLARHYHMKGKPDDSVKYIQLAFEHKDDLSYDVPGSYSQKQVIKVIESFLKQHPEIRPAEDTLNPGLSK